MANLFGKNRIRQLAESVNTEDIRPFIDIVEKWHDDYHRGSLKTDKETSREQEYNQSFFKDILGFTSKPSIPFNFEPKATTYCGQLPDAVISYTDVTKDIENISAVVELKDATTPLDRPQRREGNLSPVQQAFKYKTQYRNCPFVIVSNFYEFRLYNDNQLDYEIWTLNDLVDPANDFLSFKTWYVLLRVENFVTPIGKSKTEQILTEIRIEHENIGKKFYKVYKEVRLDLLRDLYRRNQNIRENIEFGIEKTQKILDRVVFATFAEDRGLLPDNTLQSVIRDAEKSSYGVTLWQAIKGLFEVIDTGSERLELPDGYNGGLFREDTELNALHVSDDALRPVIELSKYNFNDVLSVNILGHIFEQSISDLEEIKRKVNESKKIDTIEQPRRKREGIFYTPDYIVRYIVENSVGAYLHEREEMLKDFYKLRDTINDATYAKRENQAYLQYQEFLQNIRVVDPACGSGAFLVSVFDYLVAENKRVGDILESNLFSSDDYVKDILQKNIYGVDLNEESVEITKLSLWLKSAKKGKKLTTLDGHIKCGNSLIDNPEVASNKAFFWKSEFPEVFENGGFDVVVGNPPYVDSESMVKNVPKEREWISNNYKMAKGNWDLLIPFMELALELMRANGKMSFITSNKWLSLDYGDSIRRKMFPLLNTMCDCTMENVFESANVSSVIFGASKNGSNIINIGELNSGAISNVRQYVKGNENVDKSLIDNLSLIFSEGINIVARMRNSKTIESSGFSVSGAFTTGEAYELVPYIVDRPNIYNAYKLINTGTIGRYESHWGQQSFTYLKNKYRYPILEKSDLQAKFPRRYEKFNGPKILITGIRHFEAFFDYDNKFISTKSTVVVTRNKTDLSWLISVLNSKFIRFYIKTNYLSSSMGGGINFTPDLVRELPLNLPDEKMKEALSINGSIIAQKKEQLGQLSSRFRDLVSTEFNIQFWPNRLHRWWVFDFATFMQLLDAKLSFAKKDELLTLFEKYHTECMDLEVEIQRTDQIIDTLVYELYDLSKEEIELINQG